MNGWPTQPVNQTITRFSYGKRHERPRAGFRDDADATTRQVLEYEFCTVYAGELLLQQRGFFCIFLTAEVCRGSLVLLAVAP